MKRDIVKETLMRIGEEEGWLDEWLAERNGAAGQTTTQTTNHTSVLEVARNLLTLNAPIDMITQATGLTEEAWRAKRDAVKETLMRIGEEEGWLDEWLAERNRTAGQTTTQTTNYTSLPQAARNLLKLGTPIDIITRATGLTADEIHGQA